MKLYATITSERATKGQGGNKYLDIDIKVGSAENQFNLARLTARVGDRDGVEVYGLYDEGDNLLSSIPVGLTKANNDFLNIGIQEAERRKAKRQKGENVAGTPNAFRKLYNSLPERDRRRE